MRIFLNSASFDSQAQNLHHAGLLIVVLFHATEKLAEIGDRQDCFYRDDEFRDRLITGQNTVKQAMEEGYQQLRQSDIPPDRWRRFLSMITKSPFACEIFADAQFDALLGDEDISHSALGYTAHFASAMHGIAENAVALSLGEHQRYSQHRYMVEYAGNGMADMEPRAIWHVSMLAHIDQIRPRYEKNPKHGQHDHGAAAEMQLSDQQAQYVLDRAILLPGEDRWIGKHEGKLYMFPCHQQPNPETGSPACYHGYAQKVADLQKRDGDFYAKLHKYCDWPELA